MKSYLKFLRKDYYTNYGSNKEKQHSTLCTNNTLKVMVSFGRIALFAFYRFSSPFCTGFHWSTTTTTSSSSRLSPRRVLVNTILPFTGIATLTVDTATSTTTTIIKQPSRLVMCSTKNPNNEETTTTTMIDTGYLNAKDAYALDQELMSTPGFSLEQLMELAGLSVAEAVYAIDPPLTLNEDKKKKVLLVCGPGNNGGDGLVAARYLVMELL